MCPWLRSFQPTGPTDLIQLGLLFGPDALPKTHSRSTIEHYFTTLHSLTSEDCATLPKATKVRRIVWSSKRLDHATDGGIEAR